MTRITRMGETAHVRMRVRSRASVVEMNLAAARMVGLRGSPQPPGQQGGVEEGRQVVGQADLFEIQDDQGHAEDQQATR
jgi:hypothetical protein